MKELFNSFRFYEVVIFLYCSEVIVIMLEFAGKNIHVVLIANSPEELNASDTSGNEVGLKNDFANLKTNIS